MIEYKVRVYDNGDRFWRNQKGQYHREGDPAIEWAYGKKSWWSNGKYHREDGPAIEYADVSKYWYLHGEELTEEEFNRRTAKVKELTVTEIGELLGYEVKVVK
jgi:hypothetical protein